MVTVYDMPLRFADPLAVYFESGDYIVHNYLRNTWAVLPPVEYSAFTRMRHKGLTPRSAAAELARDFGMELRDTKRLVGRVLMTVWMRGIAVAPGIEAEPARPEQMKTVRTVPKVVYFVCTHRCNLTCAYCYADSSPAAQTSGDLTTAEALDVIDQIADLGVEEVTFTGGEALLRKDILTLLERGRARGLRCNVITNGSPVTRTLAQRLAELTDQVTVSIDSPSPEAHDRMRGRGSHKAAVQALTMLQEAGAKVAVNTTISSASISGVDAMVDWVADRGITFHRLGYVSDLGRGEGAGLAPRKEERRSAEARLFETLARRLGDIDLNTLLYLQAPPPQAVLKKHCGVGLEEISIDSNGDIYPCKLLHDPAYRAGNLRQQTLREIWESSPVLHGMSGLSTENLPGCRNCTFRYACAGGCRAHQQALTADLYGTYTADCPSLRRAIRKHMWLQDRKSRMVGSAARTPVGTGRC